MNVVKENLENQVALLKVTVSEADYAESVTKQLKEYKKKANVPGFRPGMVPMSRIEKMYKKGVTAEEAYRTSSKAVYDYIQENKIKTLGDPMPSDKQQALDFDNNTEYEFLYEIGLAPEVNIDFNSLSIKKYEITSDDELKKNFKENQLRRFGKLVDKEVVTSDEALEVSLDGEDMAIENAYVGLISMSEEERAPFIGKQLGDSMDVNVNELYKSASQRASILSVKEEELENINPNFKLQISRIRKFENPTLNEEFFAEAFPEGDITNEEQYDAMLNGIIESNLVAESDAKMVFDGKDALIEAAALTLPDEFLKKWLLAINEGKFTMEVIEKEYEGFAEHTKWSCICESIAEANDLKITAEEAKEEAKGMAAMQFAQYGMATPTDEMLENYANTIMQNREEARRIHESLTTKKCVMAIVEKTNIVSETITYTQFVEMAQQAGVTE